MSETKNLSGKVAIITGGGTGIGRGIALAFARLKMHPVICGRRKERVDAVLKEIQQNGADGLALTADVSAEADASRLVKFTLDAYGRIDILINNAAVSADGLIHEIDPEAWDRVMNTNLRAPFLLTHMVLPAMRAQRSGHIINISSESGLMYYHNDSVYGLSKHALNDFGEYVQKENQDFNIRVNTICPGMVVTEMTDDSEGLDRSKCLYPDDIADLVLWLLTRRDNIKIGTPVLIQTMLNPWE